MSSNDTNCPVCGNAYDRNEDKCSICDWDNHPVIGCTGETALRLLNVELELARSKWENFQLKEKLTHGKRTARRIETVQEKLKRLKLSRKNNGRSSR